MAMASIHETMEALREAGAIGKQTMRHFDDACLTPIRYDGFQREIIAFNMTDTELDDKLAAKGYWRGNSAMGEDWVMLHNINGVFMSCSRRGNARTNRGAQ